MIETTGFNYAELFRITLPETILELVSLVILSVDLGWLRRSTQSLRMSVASSLGVIGSLAAILSLALHPQLMSTASGSLIATPLVNAVQTGLLILTALILLAECQSPVLAQPRRIRSHHSARHHRHVAPGGSPRPTRNLRRS